MNTGVIEPLPDEHIKPRRGSRRSSGGFPPGNGGGGEGPDDNGSGGKLPYKKRDPIEDEPNTVPDKAKVITWFLLIVVLMTFGGLIGAYVVISTNNVAEWRPFALPLPVWISTILIVISSFVYHIAKRAVDANNTVRTQKFMVATTVLGATFISSQLLAWWALFNQGLYMRGNPYAGFFYIITGIHALHVAGGILALGAVLLRTWVHTEHERELTYRRNLARSVGWYWHFMGALWLVLFVLLGFWK